MTFLNHISICNNVNLSDFIPWNIDNRLVGYINQTVALRLLCFSKIFKEENHSLKLSDQLQTPKERTEALTEILEVLRNEELCGIELKENYAVTTKIGQPVLMHIDRNASDLFGIISTGFHLNGFVSNEHILKMWVARRSQGRTSFPGKLDNIVAGGQPFNLTVAENVIKECNEEASIPKELAITAKPVGLISYMMQVKGSLRRHVMYTYDLDVPPHFIPSPNDGEVEKFHLLNIEKIMHIVQSSPDSFKYNCNLVIIDFLIRHGKIKPDHPDYFEIIKGLRHTLN
jgi:isopentenyldiphosphate isomerase